MYDPEQITFFAKTDARGQQVPFGIKANDRTRHVYVIGKTGMGKSTLLENMAVQDIKNGNGLAFIDPHGQTAETLLDYIPEERKDDVVYFAPFDTDNPVSFNVMEDVGEDKRHLVVSGLMSVFKKIWVDAWSARMEYILSNTLLALLEYPDATLLGVNRMLSDKEYRMRVIENITDPAVKAFWVDEFLKYNERYMQEAGDAIKNKIGQFTSNPLIRNIIGQPHSSFDIRKIMDDKKILIMNLSKGLVGDQNANLLGSMLTTRIYLAAMSRADLSAQEMKEAPNFYFYVDEFQSFANATFADILSEARKYKLNLTIAHQYIEQMEEEVRNAVFGNVGTIISFRVGPFDAEILETVYTPTFLAPDIVNLGFAQIYLTLMIDGIGSQPFSATTLPPIEITGASYKDVVVSRSRALYTKKRGPVEEVIQAWHTKSFSNKPPYVPKHLREEADGGTLPNTGANLKKPGPAGGSTSKEGGNKKDQENTNTNNDSKKQEEFVPYKERMLKKEKLEKEQPNVPSKANAKTQEGKQQKQKAFDTDKKDPNLKKVEKEENAPQKERPAKNASSAKNLDDLRSVLKTISGDSEHTQSHDKKEGESNGGKTAATKNESDLKDALAAVLANTGGAHNAVKRDEEKVSSESRSHTDKSSSEKSDQAKDTRKSQAGPRPENTEGVAEKKAEGIHRNNAQDKHRTQRPARQPEHADTKQTQGSHAPDRPAQTNNQDQKKEVSVVDAEHSTHLNNTAVSADQQEYAQMKNIDNPLSIKKLERMMRVNTSDKPPIK